MHVKPKDVLTKEFLEEYYVKKGLTPREIRDISGIKSHHSVIQWAKKFGLVVKSRWDRSDIVTKEYLEENYVNQKKSLTEISNELNFDICTIVRYLKKYDIPQRKSKEFTDRLLAIYKNGWYEDISQSYWTNMQKRAIDRNLTFEITMEHAWSIYIKQNKKCALSGVDIEFHKPGYKQSTRTASLDRINSNLGYIQNNIQWVHKTLNMAKNNHDDETFIKWCKLVADFQREKEKINYV